MIARKCRVSGRVQGVYYRASAQKRARELAITGHARNLDDGSVEVLACGEPAQVASFIDWLWQGPPTAHVMAVQVLEHEPAQWPVKFTTG